MLKLNVLGNSILMSLYDFFKKRYQFRYLYKIYSNFIAYNAKVTLFCANHQEKRVSIEENHFIFFS